LAGVNGSNAEHLVTKLNIWREQVDSGKRHLFRAIFPGVFARQLGMHRGWSRCTY
jgi:hypothetical protein